MYKIFKSSFLYESYLDFVPRNLRFFLTKLRLSVLPLRIQTGRYARNNEPREQRYCLCCQHLDIEDEFHFVCICSSFSEIRRKYIKRTYFMRPSVFKYHQLLLSENRNDLVNLCKFVKEAMVHRNELLNRIV